MERHGRGVRLYIRNRAKYNPVTPDGDLMYVDVADYANTYIWMLKEQCKKKGCAKLDELFYFTNPSADYPDGMVRLEEGRTVAHYNLQNGTIIETTSNPFFAACMYILHEEAVNKIEANLNDRKTKAIMTKCKIHKLTIIQVLFNSQKDDGDTQPGHFRVVRDFIDFVHAHPKKGVEMSHFTEAALFRMYEEFVEKDLTKPDPIRSFVNRYAERLGCRNKGNHGQLGQDDDDQNNNRRRRAGIRGARRGARGGYRGNQGGRANGQGGRTNAGDGKRGGAADRVCENCEETEAAVYCAECEGSQALCDECSGVLHRAAARRAHRIVDIAQAPRKRKPYIPKPYRAPFAMLLALYHGQQSDPPLLSMNEDELKIRAQPLTDTDLSARSPGKRFGGFEGIEQLLTKNLIRREAAARPTYALMEGGLHLGAKLLIYHQAFVLFCGASGLPTLPHYGPDHLVIGNRRVCLLIDIYEKQRQRFVDIAKEKGVCAQIRELKVCDYMFILTPAGVGGDYQEVTPDQELVLPHIVERKTWDDLEASADTNRFRSQINKMKRSGMKDLFYLVEGSVRDMRNKDEHQREYLQELLEDIQLVDGFHLVQTFAWLRSVHWLLTMAHVAADIQRAGLNDPLLTMSEVVAKATGRQPPHRPRDLMAVERCVHIWTANEMAEKIFKEALEGQSLIQEAFNMMQLQQVGQGVDNKEHLLILQDLESYIKTRDQHMNRSVSAVCGNAARQPGDILMDQLEPYIKEILHPEVFHYWINALQLHLGVKVMVCEGTEEVALLQIAFLNAKHPMQGQRLMTEFGDDWDDGGGGAGRGGGVVRQAAGLPHQAAHANDVIVLDEMDEDAQLRFALQASLQEYQQFSDEYGDVAVRGGIAMPGGERNAGRTQKRGHAYTPKKKVIAIDGADPVQKRAQPLEELSEEEQLRLALERSVTETNASIVGNDEPVADVADFSEEEQLKLAMEASLREGEYNTEPQGIRQAPAEPFRPARIPASRKMPKIPQSPGTSVSPERSKESESPTRRTLQPSPVDLPPLTPPRDVLDEESSEDEDLKRALAISLQDGLTNVSAAVPIPPSPTAMGGPRVATVAPSPRRAKGQLPTVPPTPIHPDVPFLYPEKEKSDSSDDEDLKRALELSLQECDTNSTLPTLTTVTGVSPETVSHALEEKSTPSTSSRDVLDNKLPAIEANAEDLAENSQDDSQDEGVEMKDALELSLRERLDSQSANIAAQMSPAPNPTASQGSSSPGAAIEDNSEPYGHDYSIPDLDIPIEVDSSQPSDGDDDDLPAPLFLQENGTALNSSISKTQRDVGTVPCSTPAKRRDSDEDLAWHLAGKLSPVNEIEQDEEFAKRLQEEYSDVSPSRSIPVPATQHQPETDEEMARRLQREMSGDVNKDGNAAALSEHLQKRSPVSVRRISDEELARQLQNGDDGIGGKTESDAEMAKRLQMELNAENVSSSSGKIAKSPPPNHNAALLNHFADEFTRKRKTPSKLPGFFEDAKKAKLDQSRQLTDYRELQRMRYKGDQVSPSASSSHRGSSGLHNISWTSPSISNASPVGYTGAATFISPIGGRRLGTTTPSSRARTSTPVSHVPAARFTGGRVDTPNSGVSRQIFGVGGISVRSRTAVVQPHRSVPAALGSAGTSKLNPVGIDDDDDDELPDIKPLDGMQGGGSYSSVKNEVEDVKDVKVGDTLCNVTCGACKGKGHSRTFKQCPKFYSAEEEKRRNLQAAARREKSETLKREKEERLSMLQHQRDVLERNYNDQKEIMNNVIKSLGGKPPKSPKGKKKK